MADPRISIAMATNNGATHVREQLDTLAAQTLLPCELVVQDDRSTDDTVAIVEDFAKSAPFPVHIEVNEQNLGYRLNFRAAANRCIGDLIAFCDQDDWWREDKLQVMSSQFDDTDVLLAFHNARVVDDERRGERRLYDPQSRLAELGTKPMHPTLWSHGFTQLFRADLRRFDDLWERSLDQQAIEDAILAHDQWFMFLAGATGSICFVDEPLADYRQHSSNEYGADPDRGMLARLRNRLAHCGAQDDRSSRAMAARAEILSTMSGLDAVTMQRLAKLSRDFALFAERLQRRRDAYSRNSLAGRAEAWITSIYERDYGLRPWKFDRKSVVRDLWTGVILGRKDPA